MVNDIENALRQALPADLQQHVPALAQPFGEASSRTINSTDAEARLGTLQGHPACSGGQACYRTEGCD